LKRYVLAPGADRSDEERTLMRAHGRRLEAQDPFEPRGWWVAARASLHSV